MSVIRYTHAHHEPHAILAAKNVPQGLCRDVAITSQRFLFPRIIVTKHDSRSDHTAT